MTFWVRGAQGGEVVEFLTGGVGTATDPFRDSMRPARSSGPIILSSAWQQVEIRLDGANLSRVVGGFAWVANRCYNSKPITFYIDDIVFDFDPAPQPLPAPAHPPFSLYSDNDPGCNRFVPSGFMGDRDDITLDLAWTGAPHSGRHALKASYAARGRQGNGWAGVYWQEPKNNWGDLDGGFDLRWANTLTFWARGERGSEKIQFLVGGVGTDEHPYPDSLRPALSTGLIALQTTWQKYTIDLRGQDLDRVIGGFAWAASRCVNPGGVNFYLDDIAFAYDPTLPPLPLPPALTVFSVYSDVMARDNHYFPTGWMGDAETPGQLSLNECWPDNPHHGATAIKITYTQGRKGWAGVYWVDPAGNWGDAPGGFDLSAAKALTFWARSDTPEAKISILIGGIGYEEGRDCSQPIREYPDSVCPVIETTIGLTPGWTQYTIPLEQHRDKLDRVVGGFGWTAKESLTFYFDDIAYELDPALFPPPPRTAPSRCFVETMHCLQGRFVEYWNQQGNLPVFGFPITAARKTINRDTRRYHATQWLERNRFEFHHKNASPYDVLLGRLGDELLRRRGIDWQKQPRESGARSGCLWFIETGHNVCDQAPGLGFKTYWEAHGLEFDGQAGTSYRESLALFGLPLTEPTIETNASGDTVLTQWFERARFEWHPDKPDQYKVLLGLLGNEAYKPESAPVEPGIPTIEFTAVPVYGSSKNLEGRVLHVQPAEHRVAVYIYVAGGWWTKPYWNTPLTTIRADGTWTCAITTGGIDERATKIVAYLVPAGFSPPLLSGGSTLPGELDEFPKAEATRGP